MSPQEKEHLISRIIELEMENCQLVFDRKKPTNNDSFSEKRHELNLLRCIFFGYNSNFCNIKKGS